MKAQKGFSVALVLVGVLTLVALGGAYYLQNKEALLYFSKSQTPKPQPHNVVTSQTPIILQTPKSSIPPSMNPAPTGIDETVYTERARSANVENYLACGCGCCGGAATKEQCLYKSKGESLEKVRQEDEKIKASSSCAMMGCSSGIIYKYCD